MTLARVKTWTSEVLTATDLNAEFNNILNFVNASKIQAVDSLTLATNDVLQYSGTAWANKTPAVFMAASQGINASQYLSTTSGESTFGFARSQKTTGIAQSTTADILRLLDTSGTLFGNTFAAGLIYTNLVDEANAANNSSYISVFLTQGDGTTTSETINLDGKVRGTTLLNTFLIASDGASGAGKFQITTAASGKTITARSTFIGQVR